MHSCSKFDSYSMVENSSKNFDQQVLVGVGSVYIITKILIPGF